MTDRYDDLRMAPDPERAEALRRRLHAQLVAPNAVETSTAPVTPQSPTPQPKEIGVLVEKSKQRQSPSRILALVAAVAVVAIAGTAIVINLTNSDSSRPASDVSTTPTEPTTATTSPPSTAPLTPPPTDAEIADASLLASDEYGLGYERLTLNGTAPWGSGLKMDAAIAQQVPACTPYLDTAFESSTRDAVATYTMFIVNPDIEPALFPQYVVVFPDEAAAQAMFDAITDPGFLEGCVPGYIEQMNLGPKFTTAEFVWFPFFAKTGTVTPPALSFDADQVALREYVDAGGPDVHFEAATVRVGRVVALVEALAETKSPNGGALTDEQFQQMVQRMIDKARAAQAG